MRHLYCLILLFLTACHNSPPSQAKEQEVDYERIADAITHKTAKKIEAETGLRLIGIGGGMMNHIRSMAMSFNQFGEISIDKARELLFQCLHEYLSAINTDEAIRPYLIHYPFTQDDIEIRIFIRNPDRRDVPVGSLAVAAAIRGILDYDLKGPGVPSLQLTHKETYEEAVNILETQKGQAQSLAL